jgi:hypothetical protein
MLPVGHIAFQAAYGHWRPLLGQNAAALALYLLGTDPTADSGQAVLSLKGQGRLRHIPVPQGTNEDRNFHAYRTAFDALGLLALKTSASLFCRLLWTVSQGNLMEVAFPLLGRLLGHLHPV